MPSQRCAMGKCLAKHRPTAVNARTNGAEFRSQDVRDLLVTQALHVTQHYSSAKVRRQGGQGALDIVIKPAVDDGQSGL